MGVYIDMEMPKVGGKIITIYADGRVLYDGDYIKAVPVPPHGRLIDADALLRHWEELAYSGGDCELYSCMGDIRDAPTIIPASEEGK